MPKKEPLYFAQMSTENIGAEISRVFDEYTSECRSLGLITLWEESYFQYYRGYYTRGMIEFEGRTGEFRSLSYNHYRNLLQHILTQTTSQRPAFDPMAVNSDFKSTSQIQIARNLLDYQLDMRGLEEYINRAAEYSLILGEGYLIDEWDASIGEEIELLDEEGNEITRNEGEPVYENAGPGDVARDIAW